MISDNTQNIVPQYNYSIIINYITTITLSIKLNEIFLQCLKTQIDKFSVCEIACSLHD